MAKVTGKFQVTLPKAIVDACNIRVGDDLSLEAVGETIHIRHSGAIPADQNAIDERLGCFDKATQRQLTRQRGRAKPKTAKERGWKREDLYTRGRAH